MSTGRRIDKICIAAVAATLALTILFMCGSSLGIAVSARGMKYESTLFDTSCVHQIDIVMNDWDSFIENCEDEEYASCTVVIDGNKHQNTAIRAKGNTSLSSVRTMGSQRYSFKLEFDHYEDGKTMDGLDKLCLNNLIQDNTMMKDYLAYRLMDDFGVDSPLCSFAYVTVNGEDWGLYLAVEGIEDSFLARNYGSDTGELYKPDSMSFGGGRGNGKDFNMDDFDFGEFMPGSSDAQTGLGDASEERDPGGQSGFSLGGAGGFSFGDVPEMGGPGGGFPSGDMPEMGGPGGGFPSGDIPDMGGSGSGFSFGDMPEMGGSEGDFSSGGQSGFSFGGAGGFSFGNMPDMSGSDFGDFSIGDFSFDMPNIGGIGGFGGMGSDDVKLKYIDDDPDSYSNIFNNAKTDVTSADKKRLISSLKKLSSYSDLEDVLDMDEVLRYFVVHNFLCNGDSYTGTMIHNYYLHESDGKLGMIPWDYNLAFGTFTGGNASSSVNADIDDPISMGSVSDRPMLGWIFSDESYTEAYHALFNEFIDKWFTNGELEKLISDTADMIRPYVEKDPTRFCTVEEFEKGVETITQFTSLRGEAVSRQLSEDQEPVDTGALNLSDMGSMGGNFGGGRTPDAGSFDGADMRERFTQNDGGEAARPRGDAPDVGQRPETGDRASADATGEKQSKARTGSSFSDFSGMTGKQPPAGRISSATRWIYVGVSAVILAAGLLIAVKKKY